MLKFEEPVRMRVLHPTYGMVEVKAYCEVDAKMQANAQWPGADWDGMKVAVENEALRTAKREGCGNA